MQHNPEILITRQDISNLREHICLQQLQGYTPTQALVLALEDYNKLVGKDSGVYIPSNPNGYTYSYRLDIRKCLDYLFFAHPASLGMLKDNYDVLMLDCTYKVNRYKMPLCHITGRTCQGKTFDIAYAFVNNEKEPIYAFIAEDLADLYRDILHGKKPTVIVTDKEKALKNALRKSEFFKDIPQIICQWHVKVNMLSHASAKWNEKQVKDPEKNQELQNLCTEFMHRFEELLHCSKEHFDTIWAKIVSDYSENSPTLVEYLRSEWIEDCKEEVSDAFLTHIKHFDDKSTSTNKGAHAVLKDYLQDGTCDLLTVVSAAHTKIQNEVYNIRANLAQSFNRKRQYIRQVELFDDIIDHITSEALSKIYVQYTKVANAKVTLTGPSLSPCTGYYGINMASLAHTLSNNSSSLNRRLASQMCNHTGGTFELEHDPLYPKSP